MILVIKLFTFLLAFTKVSGQFAVIIDSESKVPLQNVNIFNESRGVTSDLGGRFFYHGIFDANDTITFSLIGYRTIYLAVSEIPDKIKMESIAINLESIEVIGDDDGFKKKFTRIERDVRKVYPFAKVFSNYLETYEGIMDTLKNYSGIKRFYKKRKIFSAIEADLLTKYDYSIRKLTKRQGRILIRLIDREANRTSFKIIRDFRNGFTAGFWQITARFFGHNLKSSYNPLEGEDRIIEYIIYKIENPT